MWLFVLGPQNRRYLEVIFSFIFFLEKRKTNVLMDHVMIIENHHPWVPGPEVTEALLAFGKQRNRKGLKEKKSPREDVGLLACNNDTKTV